MKVLFSKDAQRDIAGIYDYIHERNPTAAAKVVLAIRAATHRLDHFPLSGRNGGTPNTREIVVPKLPYIIVYRIKLDCAEIVAVFHAAEDRPRGY